MTPTRAEPTSSLADDVRAVREIPDPAKRREIRKKARLSLAQIGRYIGVSSSAVWQWEMLKDLLPVTDNTVRYARLLAELALPQRAETAPQE